MLLKFAILLLIMLQGVGCNAQPTVHFNAPEFLKEIVREMSSEHPENPARLVFQLDSTLILKTEIYPRESNSFIIGFDSTQRYFRKNDSLQPLIEIHFLNETHGGNPGEYARIHWQTASKYEVRGKLLEFDAGSNYRIALPEIEAIFGNFKKELIPRKISNTCSFIYKNASSGRSVDIKPDCYLPCEATAGNKINFIKISIRKSRFN